ncbi:MAG: hypothetical protein GX854_13060 [Clostridiales bacterium]|nr:hypothetical protein [Clostridiales bacterium]
MKRVLILLIIAVMLLVGCGGDGKQTQSNNADSQNFAFEYNGVEITINTDVAPIIEKLGEPIDYFEAESCAFKGLDKTYYYSGFLLTTYPKDEKTDYVSVIYFNDDSVSTKEGIYIGSSEEDVVKAYGENYTGGEGFYTYRSGDSTLTFLIEDGEVVSITYQALVDGL